MLQRTPNSASSSPGHLMAWMIPALEADYDPSPMRAEVAELEAMVTMLPLRMAAMCRLTEMLPSRFARKFVSMTRRKLSRGASKQRPGSRMPAALTRWAIGPCLETHRPSCRTNATPSLMSRLSQKRKSRTSAAAYFRLTNFSAERPRAMTRQPSCNRASVMALPMPWVAPVTMAARTSFSKAVAPVFTKAGCVAALNSANSVWSCDRHRRSRPAPSQMLLHPTRAMRQDLRLLRAFPCGRRDGSSRCFGETDQGHVTSR